MIVMKIKTAFFLVILVSFGAVQGQELLPVMYDSSVVNHQVSIFGNVFQHSSRLDNNMSRKLIFGGEISNELSQNTFENQNDYNRLGGGIRAGVEYRGPHQVFSAKPNWGWLVSVSNEIHFTGEYSDDLFGLIFIGNTPFLGDNASFANTSFRFEQFFSVGGGIHDKKTKSFLTLNAIMPQQFVQFSVNRGSAAFSSAGDQVDLRLEGEAMLANSHAYFKGLGAALNFDFNIPFGSPETFNGVVGIVGRNIGGYQIHKTDYITINTSQSYSGFALNELIEGGGLSTLKDSLNLSETIRSEFKLLPGFIQVGKVVQANALTQIQSFFGVRMYTNRVYKPLVYAGLHYQPLDQFSFGAQGSFGGYGNLRLGLYANYNSEQVLIGVGTEDLLGAILGTQYGHSGLIRIAWKI